MRATEKGSLLCSPAPGCSRVEIVAVVARGNAIDVAIPLPTITPTTVFVVVVVRVVAALCALKIIVRNHVRATSTTVYTTAIGVAASAATIATNTPIIACACGVSCPPPLR